MHSNIQAKISKNITQQKHYTTKYRKLHEKSHI